MRCTSLPHLDMIQHVRSDYFYGMWVLRCALVSPLYSSEHWFRAVIQGSVGLPPLLHPPTPPPHCLHTTLGLQLCWLSSFFVFPPLQELKPFPLHQYSPRACELVRSEPSPRSSASAPWTTWRRTERSASLWPRLQTQDPHPSCLGGASAGRPTRLQHGGSVGSARGGPDADAARLSLWRLAPWPFSWFSTAAVESRNAGSAIWVQWVRRLRREPPYRTSSNPGAPSTPPEASHITRSRWKYQNCHLEQLSSFLSLRMSAHNYFNN